ncbi:hypothetical protein GW916_04030 [bacterium]|nr:hypothetical protein [bacterium]
MSTRAKSNPSKSPRKRGQILILMAMMSTTLMIFFGMVVSIGHLIQARVNLQNSVDLAAMVGASYQTRYLNAISIINYRLRQNYKFVLSDLYMTQSRFNKGWQDALRGGGGGLSKIDLNGETVGICMQAPGYQPTTPEEFATGGRAFPETNLCRHLFTGSSGIPHIRWTPVPSFNPIVQAINLTNLALSEDFKKTCDEARDLNGAYFDYITTRLLQRNETQVRLLSDVLVDFASAFPRGPDREPVGRSNAPADVAMYKTFRQNLIQANDANFDSDGDIEYLSSSATRTFDYSGNINALQSEALSSGGGGNFGNYFDRQLSNITINVVLFQNTGGACRPVVERKESNGIFLGLSRSRNSSASPELNNINKVRTPFHIVLRARVRPNILFWPRGLTPYITAVGAAKPFGSRIGPRLRDSNIELTGQPNVGGGGSMANISFYPGDTSTTGDYGYAHKIILQGLADAAFSRTPAAFESGAPSARPHPANAPDFMKMTLAPTLYEGLMWSIFPYPAEIHSRGPADFAAFPTLNLGLGGMQATQIYQLEDRGGGGSPTAWHETYLELGAVGRFRLGGKPKFYADVISAASAFNPEWQNASDITAALSGGAGGPSDASGRTGYQIKLTSIPQICKELQGTTVGINSSLQPYCSGDLELRY